MVGPPISLKGENVVNCDEEGEVIITWIELVQSIKYEIRSGSRLLFPDKIAPKLLLSMLFNLTVYMMTESSKHLLFVEISPKSRAFHSIC